VPFPSKLKAVDGCTLKHSIEVHNDSALLLAFPFLIVQEKNMNRQALQDTKIRHSSLQPWSIVFLVCGTIVGCLSMVSSSIGQSVGAVTQSIAAPPSIISLAAAPKPSTEIVARHPGDSKFENAPGNYRIFPAATVRKLTGAEVLTLNFAGETTLARIRTTNNDFVIEPGGTCLPGISYSRGESCSLIVRFNPQGPGHRLGFLSITHSADSNPVNFGLAGNGYAPAISFTPSVISTVPGSVSSGVGTISGATSMAVDGGDILYIADTGNNRVKLLDSSGNLITTALNPIATPASITAASVFSTPPIQGARTISASSIRGVVKRHTDMPMPRGHARRALRAHSRVSV